VTLVLEYLMVMVKVAEV